MRNTDQHSVKWPGKRDVALSLLVRFFRALTNAVTHGVIKVERVKRRTVDNNGALEVEADSESVRCFVAEVFSYDLQA